VLPARGRQHQGHRYCGRRTMRERAGPRFFADVFFFAAFFLPVFRFFVAMNDSFGLVTDFIITRDAAADA
jgi:hypothetical protein